MCTTAHRIVAGVGPVRQDQGQGVPVSGVGGSGCVGAGAPVRWVEGTLPGSLRARRSM
jgi:hypothetical protein